MNDPDVPLLMNLVAPAFAIYSTKMTTGQGGVSGPGADTTDKATAWLNKNSAGTAAYRMISYITLLQPIYRFAVRNRVKSFTLPGPAGTSKCNVSCLHSLGSTCRLAAVAIQRSVGSSLSRSQSPTRLTASVVSTIVMAGASMIQGARVRYSRP